MGSGKFWKLKMQFPAPGEFWKREDFQNGYGKVLDFSMENCKNIQKWMQFGVVSSTVYVMFVHFTIYATKHNPSRNYKIYF